jgi:hypothetical protein
VLCKGFSNGVEFYEQNKYSEVVQVLWEVECLIKPVKKNLEIFKGVGKETGSGGDFGLRRSVSLLDNFKDCIVEEEDSSEDEIFLEERPEDKRKTEPMMIKVISEDLGRSGLSKDSNLSKNKYSHLNSEYFDKNAELNA